MTSVGGRDCSLRGVGFRAVARYGDGGRRRTAAERHAEAHAADGRQAAGDDGPAGIRERAGRRAVAADRAVGPRGDARREQRSSRVPRADHGRRLGVATYLYNINHPGDSDNFADTLGPIRVTAASKPNAGINGLFYPLHPDATASRWTRCGSRSSARSTRRTAGLPLDTVYGKTACSAQRWWPEQSARRHPRRHGDLHQPGLRAVPRAGRRRPDLQGGKFGTLIGYEVAQTVYNQNITRGSVYNLLEPIDHIGILASYALRRHGLRCGARRRERVVPGQPRPQRRQVGDRSRRLGERDRDGRRQRHLGPGERRSPPNFDGDESGLVNLLVKVNPIDRSGPVRERRLPVDRRRRWPRVGRCGSAAASRSPIARACRCAVEYVAGRRHGLGFGWLPHRPHRRGLRHGLRCDRNRDVGHDGDARSPAHRPADGAGGSAVRRDRQDVHGEGRRVPPRQLDNDEAQPTWARAAIRSCLRRSHLQLQQVRRRVDPTLRGFATSKGRVSAGPRPFSFCAHVAVARPTRARRRRMGPVLRATTIEVDACRAQRRGRMKCRAAYGTSLAHPISSA